MAISQKAPGWLEYGFSAVGLNQMSSFSVTIRIQLSLKW